jgi:hypothetical protein
VSWSVILGSEKEGVSGQVSELLNARTLDLQTSFFKLTIKSNAKSALEELHDMNPATKLWTKLDSNTLLFSCLSEYMKVADIDLTAVLESVEDERTFSTLKFMKSKLRTRLGPHLDTTMRMFSQGFYNQEMFFYQETISHWHKIRSRIGADL